MVKRLLTVPVTTLPCRTAKQKNFGTRTSGFSFRLDGLQVIGIFSFLLITKDKATSSFWFSKTQTPVKKHALFAFFSKTPPPHLSPRKTRNSSAFHSFSKAQRLSRFAAVFQQDTDPLEAFRDFQQDALTPKCFSPFLRKNCCREAFPLRKTDNVEDFFLSKTSLSNVCSSLEIFSARLYSCVLDAMSFFGFPTFFCKTDLVIGHLHFARHLSSPWGRSRTPLDYVQDLKEFSLLF